MHELGRRRDRRQYEQASCGLLLSYQVHMALTSVKKAPLGR